MHRSKICTSIGLLVAVLLLAGCGGSDEPEATATPVPTATHTPRPTAIPPTATDIPPTWTPVPTATPANTRTPLPSLTPLPTFTATPLPTVDPAQVALEAQLSDLRPLAVDNAARLREVTQWELVAEDVAWSPDGVLLAVASNYTIYVYDGHAPGIVLERQMLAQYTRVLSLAFSADGNYLAAGYNDGRVRVWNPHTGALAFVSEPQGGDINDVAFSPDSSTLYAGGSDGTIRVWRKGGAQFVTWEPVEALRGHRGPVYALAFPPRGNDLLLSAGEEDAIYVWDLTQTGAFTTWPVPLGDVFTLAFHPRGNAVAASDRSGDLMMWSLATGEFMTIAGEDFYVTRAVAYSPDGTLLVAGSNSDGLLHIWDTATYTELAAVESDQRWLDALAFSPDGTLLVTVGQDRVRVWGAP